MEFSAFWEEYRKTFREKLLRFSKPYLKDEGLVEKLEEVIYEAFTKGLSKNFFYYLAIDFAKRGENIKTPLLKTLLETLKDFIEFALKGESLPKETIKEIKRILSHIEEISEIIDKAYQDYYESLKEKIKEEEIERKKFLLKEAQLVALKREPLTLIFSYKELPIYCKGVAKSVEEDIVLIEFEGKCLMEPLLKVGETLYAKAKDLSDAVKMEVLSLEENGFQARLIGYEEVFLEKRQHVRVVPESSIPIYISLKGKELIGEILDISLGGVGVFLKERAISKGDVAELRFTLKGNEIRVKAECRYTMDFKEGIRAGFMFLELDKKSEQIIGEYVMQRQLEILKELKALTGT